VLIGNRMKIHFVALFLTFGFILAACGPSEAERNAQATAVAASLFATQTAQAPPPTATATIPPSATPTLLPTSSPEVPPGCPAATAGRLLFEDEEAGFCLLYPEGYGVVIPFAGEVCLVPGEPPYLACHNAGLFVNIEQADRRTADQVADALIAGVSHTIQRSALTIAGEAAVMLEPFYDQATSRIVLVVHAGRLYTLKFIGPWGEDGNPELEQSEQLYAQITGSFGFLP
jgi:hypothetical protein